MSPELLDKMRPIGRSLFDLTRKYILEHPDCTDQDAYECVKLAAQIAVKDFTREELEQIAAIHLVNAFRTSTQRLSDVVDILRQYDKMRAEDNNTQPGK